MVSALPEAYLALVNTKCCSKGALGQASQDTSGAELAACDQVGEAGKIRSARWIACTFPEPP